MGCGTSKAGGNSSPSGYDVALRMALTGDAGVGKTSLLIRFADDDFMPSVLTTIGIEFRLKTVDIQGKRVRLQLCDVAGTQRHMDNTAVAYTGAQAVIVMYDISDRRSFLSARTWMKEAEEYAMPGVNKLLVGNKVDLHDRMVSEEDGRALAQEHGYAFFETSAKTGFQVQEAILAVAQDVLQRLLAEQGQQAEQ